MSCPAGTCQEAWTQSDGHGRTFRQHRVIEVGTYPYTEYEYFADDAVKKATDARGVVTNYTYYQRGLMQNMNYALTSWASSGIQSSASVTYEYDAMGKRNKMIDGLGQVIYAYDTLNRMTSESRTFSNLTGYTSSNFISQNNVIATYTLGYEYDLANRLTKLTDPWQGSTSYQYDISGRTTTVTANGYGNYDAYNNTPVTNIVSGTKYRAWDALKQFDTGTVTSLAHFDYSYNARLLPTQINQGGRITTQTYYDDGKLQDTTNNYRATFNSHFEYDHAGRIKLAKAGNNTDWTKNPYFFVYDYNVFGDTLKRTGDQQQTPPGTTPGHYWSQQLTDFTATWANHRDASLQYDAIGNLGNTTDYNQAGQLAKSDQIANALILTSRYNYSGDGERTYTNAYYHSSPHTPPSNDPAGSYSNEYYLRSTLLGGQVVASFSLSRDIEGKLLQLYHMGIFFNGGKIAEYYCRAVAPPLYPSIEGIVTWVYDNPVTGSRYEHRYRRQTNAPPQILGITDSEGDPVGADVAISDPALNPPPSPNQNIDLDIDRITGDIHDYRASCKVDGALVACSEVMGRLNSPASSDWARSVHFGPFARAIGIISVFAGPDWRTEGSGGEVVTGVGRRFKFTLAAYQTLEKLSEPNWKSLLSEMLSIKGCEDFVKALINTAASAGSKAYSDDITKVFDKVQEINKLKYDQAYYPMKDGTMAPVGGLASGSIGTKDAMIQISPPNKLSMTAYRNPMVNAKIAENLNYNVVSVLGSTLLHELIHQSGMSGYSDYELAGALVKMGYIDKKTFDGLDPNKDGDVLQTGILWDTVLSRKCRRPEKHPFAGTSVKLGDL